MDNCISVKYLHAWETESWQGPWESVLQGCKSIEDLNQGPGTRDGSMALWQSSSWKFVRACRMRNEVLLLLGQVRWHKRSLHLSFASAKSSVILLESNHLRRIPARNLISWGTQKCPLHILFIFKPNFYDIEVVGLKAPPDCSSASQ